MNRQMASGFTVAAAAILPIVLSGCAPMERTTMQSAFQDCTDCPEMVSLPAGRFTMGTANSSAPGAENEGPAHDVRFAAPFAVGKFEVTRGQYAAFIKDSGHDGGNNCEVLTGSRTTAGRPEMDPRRGMSWANPGFAQTDQHPAVCVSWDDARAYAAWLTRKTGNPYRLLSEAEWEYAAGARARTRFFFGTDVGQLCRYGNVRDQAVAERLKVENASPCNDGYATTTAPAGSFQPNAFGVFDTIGNVWEWVADCESTTYRDAPADGAAWDAPGCANRGIRGGSRGTQPEVLHTTNRAFVPATGRNSTLGFRVARTLP